MKHWILPALAATMLAACAGTPEDTTVAAASSAAQSGAAPTAPAAAPAALGGTSATPGDVATGTGSMQVRTDGPTVAMSRPGYRARQRDGETLWCRTETPTGSRMPVEKCYTAAQLDAMAADAEAIKDSIQQTRSRCVGGGCANGT
jgi:hypothetical protein